MTIAAELVGGSGVSAELVGGCWVSWGIRPFSIYNLIFQIAILFNMQAQEELNIRRVRS
jgi:hypothetical protein